MMLNNFLRKIKIKVFQAPLGVPWGPQRTLGAEGAPNPKIMKNAVFFTLLMTPNKFLRKIGKSVFGAPWGPLEAEGAQALYRCI